MLRAFHSVFRALFGIRFGIRLGGGLRQFGGQYPPVVELETAPAAVEELPFTGDTFQQVQEAAVEFIDPIRGFQLRNAIGTAYGTAAGRAQMVSESSWDELLAFAFLAFIDRHVTEAFKEGPVNATQFSTALAALQSHGLFITQFA
jgi:hypothetical protein